MDQEVIVFPNIYLNYEMIEDLGKLKKKITFNLTQESQYYYFAAFFSGQTCRQATSLCP